MRGRVALSRLRAILARPILLASCSAGVESVGLLLRPRSQANIGVVLAVWHGIWNRSGHNLGPSEPIRDHHSLHRSNHRPDRTAGGSAGRSGVATGGHAAKDRRAAHPRKCCTTPCRRFSPPGRFADIQAEADRTDTAGVRLRFLTVANFFVGMSLWRAFPPIRLPNQLASATRLQLGELYTHGESRPRARRHPTNDGRKWITTSRKVHGLGTARRAATPGQYDLPHRSRSARVVGEITLEGDAGYSIEQIKEIARLHSGEPVDSNRITRALQRIRSRYQKQNRLLAQVEVASRTYRPDRNTVDYVFKVDRGPVVDDRRRRF